jgi:hypothetical protein
MHRTGRRLAAVRLGALLGLCAAWSGRASAQARTVIYEGSLRGIATRLTLRIDGTRVEGSLEEQGVSLPVRGTLSGQRVQGGVFEPASGARLIVLVADLRGDEATMTLQADGAPQSLAMRRVGAPAPAGTGGDGGAGRIEPSLVGRWRHESQINSPGGAGGFASFSTVRTLEFGADGRVRQSVRSVGGGGTWSSDGGERLEFSGRWQTRGAEIWVQADGHSGFERAALWRLVDGRLVTEDGQGRRIWQR